MKKLISLVTTTILLFTSVTCMTGCSFKPSQKEINAARENAVNYASIAYQTVSEKEWFDDYTFVGVHCNGLDYEHFKEPVQEYPSEMAYVDITNNNDQDIETTTVAEKNLYFEFYFTNQDNECFRCDALYVGGSKMISVETGEVVFDVKSLTEVDELAKMDQDYFDKKLSEVRQNGYKVNDDNNCAFFIEANEIVPVNHGND